MESYKKTVNLGNQEILLETGKVARQATGAVLACLLYTSDAADE